MSTIRVFEPPLCCNTGVCGPELDQALVSFTADLTHLASAGADIARFNLASDPVAFAENAHVVAFLQTAGSEGLPLILVDGITVMAGRYPTREELVRFSGTAPELLPSATPSQPDGCCGGATVGCGETAR